MHIDSINGVGPEGSINGAGPEGSVNGAGPSGSIRGMGPLFLWLWWARFFSLGAWA